MTNSVIQTAREDLRTKFGIEFPYLGDGEALGEVVLADGWKNFFGVPYGGMLFHLADVTAGMAFLTAGGNGPTVSGNIEYLRGVQNVQKLICRAKIVKGGARLFFVDTEVYDEKENLLAKGSYIYTQKQ